MVRQLSGRQRGLSLIEVLVALAVLSVGLLGTAALQVQAKRSNLGAVERTTASMLINDLFERMRANPDMFAAYRAAVDKTQNIGLAADAEPNPDCATTATACTPNELALHDVWEWEQALIGTGERSADDDDTGGLVLPFACMTGPADGSSGFYTVTINWRGHTEFTDGSRPDLCGANDSGRYDGNEGQGTLRRVIIVTSYLEAA